ncbi:uncharacterized protein LOC119597435 isoform X2 [Penaeus monodon]|uniref:uncharacterized protein LOC119597435 isoform X2 n=1 Tax=Penaeus monodon TaxID=6687 RepID=UPI0018A73EE0|nr:uncharacterized protein LOC119597435 isoform X2 [Penaeus monodon]
MSSRSRGRGHRGSGRGGYGHRGGGNWGGNRGGHRGAGGGGGRMDYYHHHHHHGGRSPHPSQRQHDPEKLLASLGPEAQLALTTAIINSVLKTPDGREGRGNFRDNREPNYRHQRDPRRDGRGGYYREESRERRHFGEDRRYEPRSHHQEGRSHHYDREKPPAGPPRSRYGKYPGQSKRRPSPHGHPGAAYKRQRMESIEAGGSPHREEFAENDSGAASTHDRPRDREHHSEGPKEGHDSHEVAAGGNGTGEGEGGPSGVQVTIRADGERAVNSEGHVRTRVAGRLFVELRCPHCPSQRSITFKEYKFHLGSEGHKQQLNRLARKHSVVLRKIRVQQRQEQKEIEAKWREENGEEFKSAVTRFCSTCKLAFKCLGKNSSDGISHHSRSKLHRMQRHYLHPRCGICRITFPSRMVYEHHIASINHLRVRTATIDSQGGSRRNENHNQEEEGVDLDLANFMTLDSVGEDDDEEVGSEHEEITGGIDAVEAAEKEAATGDEDEDEDLDESESSSNRNKGHGHYRSKEELQYGRRGRNVGSSKGKRHRAHDRGDEDEEEDIPMESDWDKDQPEEDDDEDEEEHQPLGTEYVRRIEAYFCSLCYKIIRADSSLGSRAVQRHCRSFDHLSHYHDQHPASHHGEDGMSGDEAEGDLEDDPDQAKLWEEVDKGLTALQGEIMTEIEGEDGLEGNSKTDKKENGGATKEKESEEGGEEEKGFGNGKQAKEASREEDKEDESPVKEEEAEDMVNATTVKEWEEVGEEFTE